LTFRRLIELHPASLAVTGPANPGHSVVVLDSGNPLPAPRVLDMGTVDDSGVLEIWKVLISSFLNVFLIGTTPTFFAGGSTTIMSNALGQTFTLVNPSVVTDPQNQAIPAYCTSIKGICPRTTVLFAVHK